MSPNFEDEIDVDDYMKQIQEIKIKYNNEKQEEK